MVNTICKKTKQTQILVPISHGLWYLPDTGNKKENQMLKTAEYPSVPVLTRWLIKFAKNETNANCNSNLSRAVPPPRYGK